MFLTIQAQLDVAFWAQFAARALTLASFPAGLSRLLYFCSNEPRMPIWYIKGRPRKSAGGSGAAAQAYEQMCLALAEEEQEIRAHKGGGHQSPLDLPLSVASRVEIFIGCSAVSDAAEQHVHGQPAGLVALWWRPAGGAQLGSRGSKSACVARAVFFDVVECAHRVPAMCAHEFIALPNVSAASGASAASAAWFSRVVGLRTRCSCLHRWRAARRG